MNDKRLELAVNAGLANLKQQDTTFGNLRNRSAGVLTTAALVTTFAGGLGLIEKSRIPRWAALALLVVLVLIGVLVVAVQWPARVWSFGLDPGLILERVDSGYDEDGLHRYLARELKTAMSSNDKIIHKRGILYRIAAGLLMVEVVILAITFFYK